MKEWFEGLQPRERLMLMAGGTALVIMLFYLMIWTPVNRSVSRLEKTVVEQESLLQWMKEAAEEVKKLRGTSGGVGRIKPGQSLLSLIDQTARTGRLGEALKRVKPDGENKVSVWLENAGFDDLTLWLESLQRTYGVEIVTMVVDQKDTPGKVDARVVFAGIT